MRVRDHILLSTAGTALLVPRLGVGAVGLWAGGVLIDVDHYVWFCVRHRCLSPRAALRFFGGAHPTQTRATRILHDPAVVAGALALSARRPRLRPLVLGIGLHVGLDAHHAARMNRARATALHRDRFSCRACGQPAPHLEAHSFRQPWLLPSYRAHDLVSLCGPCHELAHAHPCEVRVWR